ncbi:MAG: hypothetical protein IJ124_03560 [Clostridia bacterium]|nr:hypothetical protein [Caulobacteraceae bacterium]MBQ8109227.1 hypothetical protein [Clostridia bacterium]
MTKVIIYGGGALGLELSSYLKDQVESGENVELAGVVDAYAPRMADIRQIWPGVPAFQNLNDLNNIDGYLFLIGVGDSIARLRISDELDLAGAKQYTLVHPRALVAATAVLEPGVILAPFTFVGPFARVQQAVVINTYGSVGHDACLGKASTLSPYACLNGGAVVGEASFLGSAAILTPRSTIGVACKMSAGSVFKGDAPDGSLIHGNPAKARQMFRMPVTATASSPVND